MKPLSKTSQRLSPQYVGHDRMPVFIYWRKIIKFVVCSAGVADTVIFCIRERPQL